jgi:NAD+ kinase
MGRRLHGSYRIEERTLLSAGVWRGQTQLYSDTALNDVVVNRAGRGGMIEVRVELDDVYMHAQRADGLIIATPTGSTAYALSAGGPLLHPGLDAMMLVPVAPQTLSNRPIVVPGKGVLKLTLTAVGRAEFGANVHFDMQSWSDLKVGDHIIVKRAPYTARFVHPEGYSFFSTLRRKLHWNLMPEDSAE